MMISPLKRSLFVFALLLFSYSLLGQSKLPEVKVQMDLVNVADDKVNVSVFPPKISSDDIIFYIPKIVPGTYAISDFGNFIENVKAFDAKGNELPVAKMDENSWKISQAKKLNRVSYRVNDTFDVEDTHDIFSPSGTNILANENFVLNMHGFVGYFKGMLENPYRVEITKPNHLYGATAMVDLDKSDTKDVFVTARYADLVDNPIMYARPDYTTFKVDDMDIIVSVYSPNGIFSAKQISADMERMMRAQKKFLGPIDNTKKYAILLYLSDMEQADAQGFGALEHNTSTVVILPEQMDTEYLIQTMIDVVSHEFFHIVTPLSIHSNEIHFFDFNSPKMSQHLWMYEGITEYFANLFQVNQGLIDEEEFFSRMTGKIQNAKRFDDAMPFTKMSRDVLKKPYKDNYLNVYEKGTLIAMCIDIIIREKSKGERGILDLMLKLSKEFGQSKPFSDDELFDRITALTYPEVRTFLNTHVDGPNPINYETYLKKMGVGLVSMERQGIPFLKGQEPYITIDPQTMEIKVMEDIELNDFFNTLGIKGDDTLLSFNGTEYNYDNIYDLLMSSMGWQTGEDITVEIRRDGKKMTLKGKVVMPIDTFEGISVIDEGASKLREAWLRK
ncbi:MAG: peptidase M61 [Flavobacterium sp.]